MNYLDYLADLLSPSADYLELIRDDMKLPVFRKEHTCINAAVTMGKRYFPEVDKSGDLNELLDAMDRRHKIHRGLESYFYKNYRLNLQYNRDKYNSLIQLSHEMTHVMFNIKGFGNETYHPFTHEIAPFVTEHQVGKLLKRDKIPHHNKEIKWAFNYHITRNFPGDINYIRSPWTCDVDRLAHSIGVVIAPALSKKVSEKGIEFNDYCEINDRNVVKKLKSFGLNKDNVLEGVIEASK
jgi:hypothetical protein